MFANMFGIRDRRVRRLNGEPVVLFGVLDRDTNELIGTYSNRAGARDGRSAASFFAEHDNFVVVVLRPEYA